MTASTSTQEREVLRLKLAKDKSHHLPNSRFTNPWPSDKTLAKKLLADEKGPEAIFPNGTKVDAPAALQLTWLGHASLLLQIDGINVLIDPLLTEQFTPFPFYSLKRYSRSPCTVQELPKLDALIISHNHRDHFDCPTFEQVSGRFPDIPVFAPLGNKPLLESVGFRNITIADWWEELTMLFDDADGTFKFACTPAQHSSSRSQVDNMATLWSSWVVEGPSGRRFFCAGDTGYTSQYNNPTKAECPAFKQIGPEHYMCGLNVQPEDSVRIHEDVGAVKSVGIHWGTFMITSEPVDEPPQRFTQEMEKRNHGGEYAIISTNMANDASTERELLRQKLLKDKSHHHNGRFINPWPSSSVPKFVDIFKYIISSKRPNPAEESVKQGKAPEVVALDHKQIDEPAPLQLTWLGHASLLVQIEGANILCDPVFSDRCAPSQLVGPKRYTKAPCTVADLPHIDILVLSHNHYDHLDWNTLKEVSAKYPDIQVFAPLGNQKMLKSLGFANIQISDWWEEFSVPLATGITVKLACTPAQHATGRGLFDKLATLWCSWVMEGPSGHKFFFSGDTAYSSERNNPTKAECPVFKQIGQVYGPFDLAAIAIGAYGPEWLFLGVHVNPEQAVRIHEDIGSRKSIGIHWGTFILTDEPVDEPPRRLQKAVESRGHEAADFSVSKIGQTTVA
ncbi:Protein-lysine N-methyltransferase efm4 [Coemansia umbellata]|uniref:Protein-lysine N-methyltransferase efm4 n=1 Tax=Coemansia umbellata TaxID=1424467 RepID=A0ABQ8PJ29_9FUNG|nr:Protein-lysine N-methyltransferase efm4 [Coemansia umbellata]